MYMRRLTAVFSLLLFISGFCGAEQFRFQYREGEKYRILSRVKEDVYINDTYSHTAEILNKIAIHVTDTKENSGRLEADFITSEKSVGGGSLYEWGEEYYSEFWRDPFGRYDIAAKYYMPVVRNVPFFPDRDIKIGETWSAEGREVHDFRKNFNVPDPFSFPIQVNYTYAGKTTKDGKEYDRIEINYSVFYRVQQKYPDLELYPVRISGFSRQELLWDNTAGRPFSYFEEFDFIFTLSTGAFVEYVGEAEAEVIESEELDRRKTADNIKEQLDKQGYGDTEVREDEEGVTISIENIQFLPDSAVLLDSEKKKLNAIADILREYPGRDLMITGHAALAGTEAGRQILSEQRARTVADFLLSTGVKEDREMMVRGMGARQPVADNSTEAGRRRNRRVEITILEN
jgi:outer membrane protein OmpA-like peptidoglycan-associated protein